MKSCKTCKILKPLSEYFKHKSSKDKLYYDCKSCWKSYNRSPERKEKQNLKNIESEYQSKKRYSYLRNYNMKKKYGIGLEEYESMLKLQKSKCAICGKRNKDCHNGLYIDHCHKSGKIRGLLCMECNSGLGKFKDDVKILNSAIKYLQK